MAPGERAPGTEGPWRPLTDLEVARGSLRLREQGVFQAPPTRVKRTRGRTLEKGTIEKETQSPSGTPGASSGAPGPRHKHSHPPLNLNNSIALPENGTLKRDTLTHLYEKAVARLHVFFKTSCAVRERTHLPPKVSQTNR